MPLYSAWQSKPWPGIQLNRSHPFAQGIQWFGAFNETTGGAVNDYGPVGLDLTVQANTVWSTTGSEPSLAMAGVSQGAGANLPAQLRLAWPITLACKLRQTASISSSTVIFGLLATNNNTTPFRAATFAWRTSNPNTFSLDWNFAGTNTIATNLFSPVIGRDYTLSAEFTASSQKLWVDGLLKYSGTATGGNPTYGTTPLLQCGPSPTGPTPTANCLMYWAGIWNQAFNADWHQTYPLAPWQAFLPQSAHRLQVAVEPFPAGYFVHNPSGLTTIRM